MQTHDSPPSSGTSTCVLNNAAEQWRSVLGFEGFYEVSSLGRVRSLSRSYETSDGKRRSMKGVVLSLKSAGRYKRCLLCAEGKRKSVTIHKMVLEAFVGPRPPGMFCRHLNGDPFDNRICNLAWGTQSENEQDKIRHGTAAVGLRNGRCSVTDADVIRVLRMRVDGHSIRFIAERIGTSKSNVQSICSGRTRATIEYGPKTTPSKA